MSEGTMIKQYALEIYEPGSAEDVAMSLESDTAFGAVARGNLLHILSDGAADFFAMSCRDRTYRLADRRPPEAQDMRFH
jgi:hypothetical protein